MSCSVTTEVRLPDREVAVASCTLPPHESPEHQDEAEGIEWSEESPYFRNF